MTNKPHRCLHCAIGDTVDAWIRAYPQPADDILLLTLSAHARTVAQAIRACPEDERPDLLAAYVERIGDLVGINVTSSHAVAPPIAPGTKH